MNGWERKDISIYWQVAYKRLYPEGVNTKTDFNKVNEEALAIYKNIKKTQDIIEKQLDDSTKADAEKAFISDLNQDIVETNN